MQNRRILITLIVASVLGLLALVFASFIVKDDDASKMVVAVSAGENIAMGTPISLSQLRLVKLTAANQPIGVTRNMEDIIGRIPNVNIAAGAIITDRMLYSANSSSGMAFAISTGKRAMTMGVNEVSNVAGFVTPGSYVDVLFSSKDDVGHFNSRIILQRILVLAVAQDRVVPEDTKPRLVSSVTLELTPQQVEALDAARLAGNISLVLRNQIEGSSTVETTQTHTSSENGVEVIRGTSVRVESGLGR
jgi:pilus assembly protein CpaB